MHQIRKNHRFERLLSFKSKDWITYIGLFRKQSLREMQFYNRATVEVLSIASI